MSYTIQAGDTLAKVAMHFGTTVNAILAANVGQIADPNRIYVGQKITVPSAITTTLVVKTPTVLGPDSGLVPLAPSGTPGGLAQFFQNKKNLILLVAAAGLGYYFFFMPKRKRAA
jgi:LysM repeat protein